MNTAFGNGTPFEAPDRPRLFGTSLPPITPVQDAQMIENDRHRRRIRHRHPSGDHSFDFRDRFARVIAFPWMQTSSSSNHGRVHQRHIVQTKYGPGARANSPAHPSVSL